MSDTSQVQTSRLSPEQLDALRSVPLGAMANKVDLAFAMTRTQQATACDTLGWQPSKLSKIVNGYTKTIGIDDARDLAEFFGCAIEDLFPDRRAVAS